MNQSALSCISNSDNQSGADSYWETYLDARIKDVPRGKHFIYVTDTHYGGYDVNQVYYTKSTCKSNYLINYVKSRLNIQNVIFGGDCFNEAPSKELASNLLSSYANEFYNLFGKNGVWVQGNHDANSTGKKVNLSGVFEDYIIPDEEVYNRTVKNIEDKIYFDTEGIANLSTLNLSASDMKEATAWFKMHYWYDDTKNKIRYVILETGDNGYAMNKVFGINGNTGEAQFRAVYLQTDFLYKAMKTCPAGYTIVVVGHMFDESHVQYNIGFLYYLYRNKLSQNLSWNRYNVRLSPKILEFLHNLHSGNDTYIYDFSDLKIPNEVLILGGHWHADYNALYQISHIDSNGTPFGEYMEWDNAVVRQTGQPIIVSRNRDAYGNLAMTDWLPWMPQMAQGTITENSFDVVTIKEDKTIAFTRFGAGTDLVLPANK